MDSTIINTILNGCFLLANAIVSSLVATFVARKKKRSDEEQAIANGVQCLLRAEIIRDHGKYMAKQYCPIYAKENLHRAYEAYHALGGNDVATDLYRQVMDLPDSEDRIEDE